MEYHDDLDASNSPELMDETQEGTDPPPKKPGSKAKGRKRTKTGCLSEIISMSRSHNILILIFQHVEEGV